jgi:hydroxymethylpyrimidine/phosphomethylpyrimidine kinase
MGVRHCHEIPLLAIQQQLEAIFDDITPDSIKIGMLFKAEIVELVADFLKSHARDIPIVLDPVMVAKSGDPLLLPEAIESLKERLLPLVTIMTPNIPEAEALMMHPTPHSVWPRTNTSDDQAALARSLLDLGVKAVLLKGGHFSGEHSNDFYIDQNGQECWLMSPRINSKNTHGTGCTLSAAIAAQLALKKPLLEACQLAKKYLFGALYAAQHVSVGKGHGPVHHFYDIWSDCCHS